MPEVVGPGGRGAWWLRRIGRGVNEDWGKRLASNRSAATARHLLFSSQSVLGRLSCTLESVPACSASTPDDEWGKVL